MDAPTDEGAGTGDLASALAHARSQAGSQAATLATVPALSAIDLPAGVEAAAVRWDEVLGLGGYAAARLRRDDVLHLTDLDGDTCLNLQVFNAALTSERLNPADTVKVQWQAYLGAGALVLSDLGRVLLTITTDTSAGHDALCGHSNRASQVARYGHGGVHDPAPNTRDLLALAAARCDLGRRDLTAGLNLFRSVRVGEDGSLALRPPTAEPSSIELRVELDVVILVAIGPHPLDDRPDPTAGRVRATAWAATRPDPDPFRTSTPERQRAFENTEAYCSAGVR